MTDYHGLCIYVVLVIISLQLAAILRALKRQENGTTNPASDLHQKGDS